LVLRNFKVDEKKVVVIPNGLNLEEFRGLKKRVENCRIILYVGRLERYKGMHYLIEALPKLDSDIVLEIVGKGPFKEHLVKLAKKLKVENRVRFFQDLPRKELLQRYVDASLFVLLSRYEAYGISVAESLAAGVPCLVANSSALTEWIDNTHCFGIDLPINVDDLVIRLNENVGKRINKPNLPSWADIAEQTVKTYNSLL
jgi:glycosyltransferase involved in cell wall biosynthesis